MTRTLASCWAWATSRFQDFNEHIPGRKRRQRISGTLRSSSRRLTISSGRLSYLLARMIIHYLPDVAIRADQMTIEHLECQTLQAGSAFTDEEVAEIGNLLFVGDKLNNKLKNKPFAEKISIIKKSGVWVDDYLTAQSSWSPSKVRKRSD